MSFPAPATLYFESPPAKDQLHYPFHRASNGPFHAAFGPIPPSATFPFILSSPKMSSLLQNFHRYALPLLHPPTHYYPSTPATRRLRLRREDEFALVWSKVFYPAQEVMFHHLKLMLPERERPWRDVPPVPLLENPVENFLMRQIGEVGSELARTDGWDSGWEAFVELQMMCKIMNEVDRMRVKWRNSEQGRANKLVSLDPFYTMCYKLLHPHPRRWEAPSLPSSSSSDTSVVIASKKIRSDSRAEKKGGEGWLEKEFGREGYAEIVD